MQCMAPVTAAANTVCIRTHFSRSSAVPMHCCDNTTFKELSACVKLAHSGLSHNAMNSSSMHNYDCISVLGNSNIVKRTYDLLPWYVYFGYHVLTILKQLCWFCISDSCIHYLWWLIDSHLTIPEDCSTSKNSGSASYCWRKGFGLFSYNQTLGGQNRLLYACMCSDKLYSKVEDRQLWEWLAVAPSVPWDYLYNLISLKRLCRKCW